VRKEDGRTLNYLTALNVSRYSEMNHSGVRRVEEQSLKQSQTPGGNRGAKTAG